MGDGNEKNGKQAEPAVEEGWFIDEKAEAEQSGTGAQETRPEATQPSFTMPVPEESESQEVDPNALPAAQEAAPEQETPQFETPPAEPPPAEPTAVEPAVAEPAVAEPAAEPAVAEPVQQNTPQPEPQAIPQEATPEAPAVSSEPAPEGNPVVAQPGPEQVGTDDQSEDGKTHPGAKIVVDESLMENGDVVSGFSSTQQVARPPATALAQALPSVVASTEQTEPSEQEKESAQQRIDQCEREAKAFGSDPKAAPLWFEQGQLCENVLRNPRQAATAYQEAFKVNNSYLPVIHAARRLFYEIGNWRMVAHLLEAEIKATSDGKRKAPLLVELGHLYDTKLAQEAEAEQSYRQAIEAAMDYGPAYDALARRLLAQKRYSELVTIATSVIESLAAGSQRDLRAVETARILESQLHESEAALVFLELILAQNPGHKEAATARVRILGRMQRDADLVGALVQLAAIEQGERRAAVLVEAARICRSRLKDHNQARQLLERAKIAAPNNLLVLRDLGDILAADEQFEALSDVLLEQAACISDTTERVALHAELGRIFEEKLHAEEKAIEQFQKVVDLDPTYQPALVSLGRLYFRHGRYPDLVSLYQQEIAHIEEPAQKVPRLFKVAEILQFQVVDTNQALEYYQMVLEIDPCYIPAQKAVSHLLLTGERWSELVEMYEKEITNTEDRDQRIFLLDKIGTTYEDKLGEVDKAIDAYQRMLTVAPGYLPAIRSLSKLYAKAERFQELIRITDTESQAIQDPKQVVALLYRTGEIWEVNLGDKDKAIEVYKKVLGLAPTYLPALKSLGRLYHERGMFDDLIEMYRQEADVTTDRTQRASLLFKIGEVYEEKLGKHEQAIKANREVLKEVPNHHPSLRALGRMLLGRNDDAGLAEIAKLECKVLEDPKERSIAKCRAALVEEIHLGQDGIAQTTFQDALADDPTLLSAQIALTRIAARNDDHDAEIAALKAAIKHAPSQAETISLTRELADTCANRADRIPESMQHYQDVLAVSPSDARALRGGLYCALMQRDYRQAIDLGERLATLEPEPDMVASLHLQIATWRSSHMDPPEDPTANYLKVLEYAPSNPVALRAVEIAYQKAGMYAGLFQLYERELDATTTPAHKLHLLLRLADMAAGPLGQEEEAIALLEEALTIDNTSTVALRRLKNLYSSAGRDEDQLRILALEADASPDPQAAVANLLEVGRLQEERTQNNEAAVECYLKVLVKEPTHNEAFARAERLLSMLERYADLTQLYQERVRVESNNDTRVGLLMRAAQLESQQLSNPTAALNSYKNALEANPRHVPALVGAGDIALGLEEYTEAAGFYTTVVQATTDGTIAGPIHERLGDIYWSHLPDLQRSVQAYVASLAVQPNNTNVLGKLGEVYISQQAWTEASDVLAKRLTFVADPEAKVDTLYKLAHVYEIGLNNPAQAAQFLEQAVEISPTSKATIERLSELYKRTNNWQALASSLSRLAQSIPAGEKQNALPIYHELGALYSEQLQDGAKAIEAYQSALSIEPGDTTARFSLAAHLASSGDSHGRAIEEYRRLILQCPTDVRIYKALRQLYNASKQRDREYAVCEILHLIRAADDDETFFFDDNRGKVATSNEFPLTEDEHDRWVLHPGEKGIVRDIMSICGGALSKAFPPDLSSYQVTRSDRLTPRSSDPLRTLADQLAKSLSGAHFDLYRCRAKGMALAVQNTDPPSLVIGSEIIRRHPNREQRFLVGSLIAGLKGGHQLIEGRDTVWLATFLSALGTVFNNQFQPLKGSGQLDDLPKRISKALSRASKKLLSPLIPTLDSERESLDLSLYLSSTHLTRVRAGMILSSDLESTLRLVARDIGKSYNLNDLSGLATILLQQPPMLELLSYAVSDEYFAARQKLRFALDS